MNERIKELIKQSQKEVWGNNPYNGSPEFEGYELDPEKFAELILREAANVADDNFDAGFCPVGYFILKHFGVME